MTRGERLQTTLPFIGGVVVMTIGLHFHEITAQALGLVMTIIGWIFLLFKA